VRVCEHRLDTFWKAQPVKYNFRKELRTWINDLGKVDNCILRPEYTDDDDVDDNQLPHGFQNLQHIWVAFLTKSMQSFRLAQHFIQLIANAFRWCVIPGFTHLAQYTAIFICDWFITMSTSHQILVTTSSTSHVSTATTTTTTARRVCDRQTLLLTPEPYLLVPRPTRGLGTSAGRLLQVATDLNKHLTVLITLKYYTNTLQLNKTNSKNVFRYWNLLITS